jgi:PTS system N-acetylgalactosamine-specific IIA component
MIGIIVSGHAHFASGITSSLELIAGKQENYEAVDFNDGDSSEDLTRHLKNSINKLGNCEKFIIFTDLMGGSPFKLAVELKYELAAQKEIEVLSGTNLGMIIECAMMAKFNDDLESLVNTALNTGKKQVYKFELPTKKVEEELDDEDGI